MVGRVQAVRLLNNSTWQSLGTFQHQASLDEHSTPDVVVYQQASPPPPCHACTWSVQAHIVSMPDLLSICLSSASALRCLPVATRQGSASCTMLLLAKPA